MNGSKKTQRDKTPRNGKKDNNTAKKRSKAEPLKWDEDIESSDDEAHDRKKDDSDQAESDDEEEETAEQTRKR
jgi:hypothetical protein